MNLREFTAALPSAIAGAVVDLRRNIGNERLYAFALYTSGEDDFGYVCASANTEEGLTAKAQQYAANGAASVASDLRWSAPDWKYHNFSRPVRELNLSGAPSPRRDRGIYQAFVAALKHVDKQGAFGRGSARANVALAIMCGDMSEAFFRRGLTLLNPKSVVQRYLSTSTPDGLVAEINRLPSDQRLDTLLDLYRDLVLERPSEAVRAARSRNLTSVGELEPYIAKIRQKAVPRLLDLIEEFGFGPPFNRPEDIPAWERLPRRIGWRPRACS